MKNIILVFFIATTISFLSCIDSANLDRDQNELPSDSAESLVALENEELFITKEAAQELQNKLKNFGDINDEYDELLQELTRTNAPRQKNQIIYDKKYFDYLPYEEGQEDSDSKSTDDVKNIPFKRINSRKFKRDLTSQRDKRQKIPSSYQSQQFLRTNTNQWTDQQQKLHAPGNFYLPPTNNIGRPNNTPYPKDNPMPDPGQLVDRNNFFGEDDEDDRLVFDQVYDPNRLTNKPVYSKSPPAPRPVNNNNNNNNNRKEVTQTLQDVGFNPSTGRQQDRVTTFAPPRRPISTNRKNAPPVQQNSDNDTFDWAAFNEKSKRVQNQNQNRRTDNNRIVPTTTPPRTTTFRPRDIVQQPLNEEPSVFSQCAIAIVNCCSRNDDRVRYTCFERYNCSGFIWTSNGGACSNIVKDAALREVEKYAQ